MLELLETTVASQRIYNGRVVSLRLDTVELTNGAKIQREIVEHGDVVAVVAIDDNGNVLLVRQFRKPAEQVLLEIPAGGLEPAESPEDGVRRELQEETGYRASQVRRLGGFYTSPGFCTEFLHLYLATDLQFEPLEPDEDESFELVRVPLAQILELIDSGVISDAKSLVGLLMLLRSYRGDKRGPVV
ncbi:MAG: NUDIX hydrolase [Chloroflexi bacterium]|nr:NUDIX hydrolase [Chloroflexota bacterium]